MLVVLQPVLLPALVLEAVLHLWLSGASQLMLWSKHVLLPPGQEVPAAAGDVLLLFLACLCLAVGAHHVLGPLWQAVPCPPAAIGCDPDNPDAQPLGWAWGLVDWLPLLPLLLLLLVVAADTAGLSIVPAAEQLHHSCGQCLQKHWPCGGPCFCCVLLS